MNAQLDEHEEEEEHREEEDAEELMRRLQRLKPKDRRRTMDRLSTFMVSSGELQHEADKTAHTQFSMPSSQSSAPLRQNISVETSSRRLKPFSGSVKLANGEVDFKHWKRAALRVLEDEELTAAHKQRLLLQSLVGKADDAIDLHRQHSSGAIIEILDKLYGSTADANDLLADFFHMFQGQSETASEYLNSLFLHLCEVIQREGLHMGELPRTLLRQFIRGVHDEDLLNKLRLEDKVDNPPNFPDLFSAVRSEESRRTERRLRHKKSAKSQNLIVSDLNDLSVAENREIPLTQVTSPPSEVALLRQRIATLEERASNRRGFCYRCGEDGHFATECSATPNKKLVSEKVELRKSKFQKKDLNSSQLTQKGNVVNKK